MLDSIISIFESFGFPIACCIFLGYYLQKLSADYRDDLKSITNEYKEAITKFQKALERNTSVLSSLNQNLEKGGLMKNGEQ